MNSTRFRCWMLGVKVTAVLVGLLWAVMTEVALATHHDASAFDWIVGLVGFFILGGSIFGGEKLYQKWKDRCFVPEKGNGYAGAKSKRFD